MRAAGASGVTVAFAGHASAVGGGEEITLQWAASEEEAGEQQAINDALHEVGVSENITVEFLTGGDVTEDRRNQYQQWLSAGRSRPDLLRMDNGWTIPFIAREQILNLSEQLPDDVVQRVEEDYFDMALQTAKGAEGGIYAVPLWVGLPTMLYRKDLVEEAGYDPEGENWATEPLTWEKFSSITADVRDNAGVEHGYTFQADVYEGLACCNFNEFMTTWGGAYFGGAENLFGPIGDRPVTVDEQPVVDSIRMVRTFIHGQDDEEALEGYQQIAPEAVLNWTEPTSNRPFANGEAIMHRNWPYFVGQHGAEDDFGQDLGVMPIPYAATEEEAEYPGTGGTAAALGGWHVAVNPNTERMDATMEVVEAATTDEFNLRIFEILGQIPPKSHLLESDRAREVPVVGRYLDTYRVAGENAIPRPVTVVWPDQSTQISQRVNAAYQGNVAPDQAMTQLAATLEEIEESV
jgi:ABC-type glycerol-3-phosphate transport system substrate-binding protein